MCRERGIGGSFFGGFCFGRFTVVFNHFGFQNAHLTDPVGKELLEGVIQWVLKARARFSGLLWSFLRPKILIREGQVIKNRSLIQDVMLCRHRRHICALGGWSACRSNHCRSRFRLFCRTILKKPSGLLGGSAQRFIPHRDRSGRSL